MSSQSPARAPSRRKAHQERNTQPEASAPPPTKISVSAEQAISETQWSLGVKKKKEGHFTQQEKNADTASAGSPPSFTSADDAFSSSSSDISGPKLRQENPTKAPNNLTHHRGQRSQRLEKPFHTDPPRASTQPLELSGTGNAPETMMGTYFSRGLGALTGFSYTLLQSTRSATILLLLGCWGWAKTIARYVSRCWRFVEGLLRALQLIALFLFFHIMLLLLRCWGLARATAHFLARPWAIVSSFPQALVPIALLIAWHMLLSAQYAWRSVKYSASSVAHSWETFAESLKALLVMPLFIFRTKLWSLLKYATRLVGVLLLMCILLRLICWTSLTTPGLTVCYPTQHNPICKIPYAHRVIPYCNPPNGPRPIANGSDYFVVPNEYSKVLFAFEKTLNLPDLLIDQIASSGEFGSGIYVSDIQRKDELMMLVENLTNDFIITSFSLGNMTASGWETIMGVEWSIRSLSEGLQEHSVLSKLALFIKHPVFWLLTGDWPPPESTLAEYKGNWITFFEETIQYVDKLGYLATVALVDLDKLKTHLKTISKLVASEQKKREMDKEDGKLLNTIFSRATSRPDRSGIDLDVKPLKSIADARFTASNIVMNLVENLSDVKIRAALMLQQLRSPTLPLTNSLTVREQISMANKAALVIKLEMENAMERRSAQIDRLRNHLWSRKHGIL